MDDPNAIIRAGEDDPNSFESLVTRYRPMVLGAVRYVLGDSADAEDAVQETFLKAWKFLSHYRNTRRPFPVWLRAIARREAINVYRKRRRDERVQIKISEQIHDQHLFESTLAAIAFGELIERLPEEFLVVFVLRECYGYSYREITRITGRPSGTIMSRLHRSRARFAA